MIDHKNKLITGENLTNNLSVIGDGYAVRDCNLSQKISYTDVCSKLSGLIFDNCNLMNCVVPKGSKITSCLVYHKDIIEPTPDEIALASKKSDIEQAALENYRVKLQTELSACATVEDVVLDDIITAIAVKQTADIKPVGKEPVIEEKIP